jgi:hypothetical protein
MTKPFRGNHFHLQLGAITIADRGRAMPYACKTWRLEPPRVGATLCMVLAYRP